eukprot:s976_g14.t1
MSGRPNRSSDTKPGKDGRLGVARAKGEFTMGRPRPHVASHMTLTTALNRLRGYTKACDMPSENDMELAEELEKNQLLKKPKLPFGNLTDLAFRELQEAERLQQERRCPSLRSIPRFYERKAAPLDESTSLRPRVLREARSRLLQRKSSKELLDEEEPWRRGTRVMCRRGLGNMGSISVATPSPPALSGGEAGALRPSPKAGRRTLAPALCQTGGRRISPQDGRRRCVATGV